MHSVPVGVGTEDTVKNGENTFPHLVTLSSRFKRRTNWTVVKTTTAFHFEPQEKEAFELRKKQQTETRLTYLSSLKIRDSLRTYMFCLGLTAPHLKGPKRGPDICFGLGNSNWFHFKIFESN